MTIEMKKGVYNKILKALRQNPNMDQIEVKDTDESFLFSGLICGGISFDFRFAKTADILILKAQALVEDKSEDEVQELGSEINEENDLILFTLYDNTMSFQLVLPCAGLDGVEGQKKVFNETLGFIHIMCQYKDRLGCSSNSSVAISLDFTTEAEDDPFGFNDFSEDEFDANATSSVSDDAVIEEEKLDLFSDIVPAMPTVSIDEEEDDEVDLLKDAIIQPQKDIEENKSEDEPEQQEDDILSMLDGKQKERERERERRKKEREEMEQQRNKQISKAKANSNKKKYNSQQAKKPEPQKNANSSIDNLDIFSAILDGTGNQPAGKKKEEKKPEKKPEKKQKAGKNPETVKEIPKTVNTQKTINVQKKEKENAGMQQNISVKGNSKPNAVAYERAPEVTEQMRHLYAEVDEIFKQRKKQADYRQETLDEYAKRLDQKEQEIKTRTERLEKNYQEKVAALEDSVIGMETEKSEIQFQWEKLKMEQEMLETKKKDFMEEQELFERTKELYSKDAMDNQVETLNSELERKQGEIERLKADAKSESTRLKSQIQSLNATIESMSDSVSDSGKDEEINLLNQDIERLSADIDSLEHEIDEISEESKEKSRIIVSMQQEQKEWKKKEDSWKKKERELENKASELQKGAGTQNKDLEEELKKAKEKIAELEKGVVDAGATAKLKETILAMQEKLRKAEDAYEKEKKAKEQVMEEKSAVVDNNKVAVEIKESLADIGIDVEPVATSSELVLSGFSEKSQVVINVDAGILYVEKPVKRGSKYAKEFEAWNQEDVRTSYLFADKKVICKCAYDDVAKAVMDVIGRINQLS